MTEDKKKTIPPLTEEEQPYPSQLDTLIGLRPEAGKRRPRLKINSLTAGQKYHRNRMLNNECSARYRKNKKQTLKKLEKELSDLEIKNKDLHWRYESINARKEKIERLMNEFVKDAERTPETLPINKPLTKEEVLLMDKEIFRKKMKKHIIKTDQLATPRGNNNFLPREYFSYAESPNLNLDLAVAYHFLTGELFHCSHGFCCDIPNLCTC